MKRIGLVLVVILLSSILWGCTVATRQPMESETPVDEGVDLPMAEDAEDVAEAETPKPGGGIWGLNIGQAREENEEEPVTYDFSDYPAPAPFMRGMNMGNMLEAPYEGAWGLSIREEYFTIIRDGGFDHVRIPIRWSAHAEMEPPYTIQPRFFRRVDEVVNQAMAQGLTTVINMHHYDQLMQNPAQHKERFLAMWQQIAERYRDYPDSLYFEILNEPMGRMSSGLWNEYLAEALSVIRQSNPQRMVVIGSSNWNSLNQLSFLEWPEDEHIIVTFHYYNPFDFTHQGAEWVNNAPPVGKEWHRSEEALRSVQRDMDRAASFAQRHNVTVWIGEFGAYDKADLASRAQWTAAVAREAEVRGLTWAYWEFAAGFGAYARSQGRWVPELLAALIPSEEQ